MQIAYFCEKNRFRGGLRQRWRQEAGGRCEISDLFFSRRAEPLRGRRRSGSFAFCASSTLALFRFYIRVHAYSHTNLHKLTHTCTGVCVFLYYAYVPEITLEFIQNTSIITALYQFISFSSIMILNFSYYKTSVLLPCSTNRIDSYFVASSDIIVLAFQDMIVFVIM